MPRHRAVVDLGGAVADQDHLVGEAAGATVGRIAGAPAGAAGPQRGDQLAFEPAACLAVESLVDRFVAHPHALVVGIVLAQPVADLFRRPAPRQPVGNNPPQRFVGDQFGPLRPRPRRFRLLMRSIGQIVPSNAVCSDLPRHRRFVLADPCRDRGHALPGHQPVGDIEPVLQRQIAIIDHRGSGTGHGQHRIFVADTEPVVHHHAVRADPRMSPPADPHPPVLGGPVVDTDLGGSVFHRRPRRDQLQKPLFGLGLSSPAPGRRGRAEQSVGHQNPPGHRERHPGGLGGAVHRSGLAEHSPDQHRIRRPLRLPLPAQLNTLGPQDRITTTA